LRVLKEATHRGRYLIDAHAEVEVIRQGLHVPNDRTEFNGLGASAKVNSTFIVMANWAGNMQRRNNPGTYWLPNISDNMNPVVCRTFKDL
jgi:hypothetical protein